ncbi:branched-chain amino acid ABC transporter permease [Xanthobacter pseudotagetidis]|uniref:branched-chain amino acid ABC transporter permease n=1 Tax=Xanthobacter pseudotagetidis TaxID=3119911 RepID=UPI003726F059
MDMAALSQHVTNSLMLGMMYALVAVGFTLFFGVLDVIKFSHGDVLMVGAFAAYTVAAALSASGIAASSFAVIALALAGAILVTALLGILIARVLVLPLRQAPALNVLLITLMAGTLLREAVRLFYPDGANPKPFPRLLPSGSMELGAVSLRYDSLILLAAGLVVIIAVHVFINRTRYGLAMKAVAQDSETARLMGVNFDLVVLGTFALGSALAAVAGVMNGLYYNEINFGMGLFLGVAGFSAAIIGGMGNFYGALLGGFLFAALQTIGTVALPIPSAYRDVFTFAVVILIMTWRPTGLLAEAPSERV